MSDTHVNRRQLVAAGGSVVGLGVLGGCARLSGGTARFAAKPAASWWHAHCPQNFAVVNILRGGTELVARASVSEVDRDVELTSWVLTQLLFVDGYVEGELVTVTTPQARLGGTELNPAAGIGVEDVVSNVGTAGADPAGGPVPASSVATETFDEAPSTGQLVGGGYQGFVTDLSVTEPLRETGPSKVEGRAAVTLGGGVERNPEQSDGGEVAAHVVGQRLDHADDAVVLAGWIAERETDLLNSFLGDVSFVSVGSAETDQPGSIVHPEECPEGCPTFVGTLMDESRRAYADLLEETGRES